MGSIQIRNYEDNQGVKRTAVDIIAQDVEFLGSKNRNEDDDLAARKDRIGDSIESYENRRGSTKKPAQRQLQVFDDDGDIPF